MVRICLKGWLSSLTSMHTLTSCPIYYLRTLECILKIEINGLNLQIINLDCIKIITDNLEFFSNEEKKKTHPKLWTKIKCQDGPYSSNINVIEKQ